MKACIGVIGGSGLDNPDLFVPESQIQEETAFGLPSSPLRKGHLKESGLELVLLSRHGLGHTIPPHRVNHRANIMALKNAGCTYILATTACGSLREDLHPGMLVVPDQFIDATHNPVTFFDTFAAGEIHHTIMADPFAPALRSALLASAQECGIPAHDGATLVSIAGPRFSTRAESRMYRSWGCDLINMTVAPECILANEAGIPYAAMAMVTDYDCWDENRPALGIEEIFAVMKDNVNHILAILLKTFAKIAAQG
ncbi:MAG TPA: MTAP family purine nucleoside phosphorylase [Candidatus Desulfovibrio intestinipullorum]|uniref:S-methyl-5'-thioadenosine phosphorylase n=1 Tax=Candidatus Desulfovibrio intestinipullorum TaxID=2838536 RepID=A0A9D1TPF7_9BACT|nr:MTAP family purine nucleoside phosphorylase [Candidatus Desulfovibrio intestinipullorum]